MERVQRGGEIGLQQVGGALLLQWNLHSGPPGQFLDVFFILPEFDSLTDIHFKKGNCPETGYFLLNSKIPGQSRNPWFHVVGERHPDHPCDQRIPILGDIDGDHFTLPADTGTDVYCRNFHR